MPKIGVDPADFWAESNRIAREQQADPLITYMHLLYKKAKDRNVRIDRDDLVAQEREVALFPGVADWFDAINAYVADHPALVPPGDHCRTGRGRCGLDRRHADDTRCRAEAYA